MLPLRSEKWNVGRAPIDRPTLFGSVPRPSELGGSFAPGWRRVETPRSENLLWHTDSIHPDW